MASAPEQRLSNQICHSLYSATNALIRAYRPLLDPLDLTYPQYLVMLALWEDDAVPVKTLVRQTRFDSGSLTPILKRLEQKGLIERRRADGDERQKMIHLTQAGRDKQRQARDVPEALYCRTQMSAEEAKRLKELTETLYKELTVLDETGRT